MDPVLFSIGSFSLRWYGVMAALGFVAGLAILQLNKKYARLTSEQVSNIVMLGMISGELLDGGELQVAADDGKLKFICLPPIEG